MSIHTQDGTPGYHELKLRLPPEEFDKLRKLADRQGLGLAEMLQYLVQLADEALTERQAAEAVRS